MSKFIIEDALLDHLAVPESAMRIWREKIDPELLAPSAEGARYLLEFVMGYIDKYRQSPSLEVIVKECEADPEDFKEPQESVEYLIDALRQRNQWKRYQRTVSKLAKVESTALEEVQEAIQFGFNEFAQILQESTSSTTTISTADALQVMDRYQAELAAKEEGKLGLTIGFPEIDQHVGGLRGLTFVSAQMKSYKSWLQTACAVGNFFNDKNAVYYALEPSKEEMQDRAACMIAQIDWADFYHNRLTKKQLDKFNETLVWMEETPNKIYFEQPEPGKRTVPFLHELAKERGADIVLIDQFYDIEPTRRGESHWIEKNYILGEMAVMSEDIPVFCSAQLNRQDQIGLSIHIEQKANLVMNIFCPEELRQQDVLHYGVKMARNIDPKWWEVKIELQPWSGFRVIGEVDGS